MTRIELGVIFQRRVLLFAQFEDGLRTLQRDEERVVEEFLKVAPKSLKKFFKDDSFLQHLLQYGSYQVKIRHPEYGLRDGGATVTAFKALRKAWGNAITLDFNTNNPARTDIQVRLVRF